MLNIFAAAMSKFGWILERSQWHRGSGGSVIFRHVRSTAFLFFWASFFFFFLAATASPNSTNTTTVKQPVLNCDPCIDRPTYTIKVIAHGTKGDPFWQRLRTASVQSALDMRVALEFELYDSFNPEQMAKDILEAATGPRPPDALVVTIPSPIVEQAVAEALHQHNVPVFGMNSGYEVAEKIGVLGYVAMDEYAGGKAAAEAFLAAQNQKNTHITRALYINLEKGNSALEARLLGFQNGTNNTQIDELVVNLPGNPSDNKDIIASALQGCSYDAILLSGLGVLESTILAFQENGCSFGYEGGMLLGTFDTDPAVYAAIATGKVSFAVSQQSHLQGALSIVFATLYATAGKKLVRSAENQFGIWLSGPKIVEMSNLPSDTLQICELSSFPVCPNTVEPDGLTEFACKCTDRSQIVIAGVLHGVTTDEAWEIVFAQANQAADDLGIDLELDRLAPQPSSEVLHSKMATKIVSLCNEGVDGLFVSSPSDSVAAAIKACQSLNVPVISVNSGAQLAMDLGLTHHISQVEYSAGFEAGKRLVAAGIEEAICINQEPGNSALVERCQGFEDALIEETIPYLGMVMVPADKELEFINEVEKAVGRAGDWEGIGMLLLGGTVTREALEVHDRHPRVLIGSFDTSEDIYNAIGDGSILFGIEQNLFVQGYLPVWLLTLMVQTDQHLQNTFIETGPQFVDQIPSESLKACVRNDFKVCPRPVEIELNHLTSILPVGLTFAALGLFASIFFASWVIIYRDHEVVKKSQPLFLVMICVGTFLMSSARKNMQRPLLMNLYFFVATRVLFLTDTPICMYTVCQVIPLSIDDSIASPDGCSIACVAGPWLFFLGFTTSFAAVFSKIWKLNRVVNSAKAFRRVTVSTKDVIAPFFILLTLNVIFLSVWTGVDPMHWVREDLSNDGLSSHGLCKLGETGVSIAMLSCLLTLNFCLVVLAIYQLYRARDIPSEFSESKYIALSLICFFQVILLGIPLIVLVHNQPKARYFVKTAIICVLVFSMLLLVFIPKIIFVKRGRSEKNSKVCKMFGTLSDDRDSSASAVPAFSSKTCILRSQIHNLQLLIQELLPSEVGRKQLGNYADFEALVQKAGISIKGNNVITPLSLSSNLVTNNIGTERGSCNGQEEKTEETR